MGAHRRTWYCAQVGIMDRTFGNISVDYRCFSLGNQSDEVGTLREVISDNALHRTTLP